MENASNFRLVLVTTNSFDNAQNIARILVSERLAACCNIMLSAYSIYGWRGAIRESLEVMLFIKTSEEQIEFLEPRIRELHPYDVPEIISLPLSGASSQYLNWMVETLTV
ncbi:MAG: divalent-cation tolerance protein CutA [Bacteroidetes bacterium]|nr:divalent-cation tolerance protein CutA [Bacteroidota bacterium]